MEKSKTVSGEEREGSPEADIQNEKHEAGPQRKPLLVLGEGAAPVKEVQGMPLFGSMKPGLSFKNAVVHSPRSKPETEMLATINNGNYIGELSIKFGALRAPLPPRVQSAPPALEERMGASIECSPILPDQVNLPEVNPTVDATQQSLAQDEVDTNKVHSDSRHHLNGTIGNENKSGAYIGELQAPSSFAKGPRRAYPQDGPNKTSRSSYRYNSNYPYHYYPSTFHDFTPVPISFPFPPRSTGSASGATDFTLPKSSKKVQIIDPNTMREVELMDVPKVNAHTRADDQRPDALPPSVKLTEVSLATKKPVVLVDPRSNQEVDLASWARNTEKLANILNEIDEDEFFKNEDTSQPLDSEDVLSELSSCESMGTDADELELFDFPVILTRDLKLKVYYPESTISFEFSSEGEPIKYSNEFMLQFAPVCKGEAKDIASVSFPKVLAASGTEQSRDRQHRNVNRDRRGRGHASEHQRRRDNLKMEDTILSNRAADAWKRASAMVLDEDLVLLREIKMLLNKLTEANFENIQNQIIEKGVLKTGMTTGIIDMFFDKAVEEPRYAPLYAQLCRRIWSFEVESLKKEYPSEQHEALGKKSIFRKSLLTKCQVEYDTKRAYSRKRLELLRSERQGHLVNLENSTAQKELETQRSSQGELTDEDYELIKMKRRVLGNMRFIGELYLVGLIRGNIMHQVIQELLKDYLDPEEEEVESVCRLLATIGAYLDTTESATQWKEYEDRLRSLSRNQKLPTRIRFMVMDLLEMRARGWNSSSSGKKSLSSARKVGETSSDARHSEAIRYSTGVRKDDQTPPRQTVVMHRQARTELSDKSECPGQLRSSTASLNTTSVGGNNRYEALEGDMNPEKNSSTSNHSLPVADRDGSIGRLKSIFEESLLQKNYDDVVLTLAENEEEQRQKAFSALIQHAVQKGRRFVEHLAYNVVPFIIASNALEYKSIQQGFANSLESLDDLAIDIPNSAEFAGIIGAVLLDAKLLDIKVVTDQLGSLGERDPAIMGKLLWYTLSYTKMDMDSKKETLDSLDRTTKLQFLCQASAKLTAEKLGLSHLTND